MIGATVIRDLLLQATALVVPAIGLVALVVIVLGVAQAAIAVAIAFASKAGAQVERRIWTRFSRWLIAGLTLQLAADIIETSATPTWNDIGRVGAVAVIRTFLNYFLERDLSELKGRGCDTEASSPSSASGASGS